MYEHNIQSCVRKYSGVHMMLCKTSSEKSDQEYITVLYIALDKSYVNHFTQPTHNEYFLLYYTTAV